MKIQIARIKDWICVNVIGPAMLRYLLNSNQPLLPPIPHQYGNEVEVSGTVYQYQARLL